MQVPTHEGRQAETLAFHHQGPRAPNGRILNPGCTIQHLIILPHVGLWTKLYPSP